MVAGPAQDTIASRDNKLARQLRQLAAHGSAYRKEGQFWVEGEHLCAAAIQSGLRPAFLVLAESFVGAAPASWRECAARTVVFTDALFDRISGLESSGRCGLVLALPEEARPQAGLASVVLDRVQDAGNVGSILRSAAAFGFTQVLALKGGAALWSPKVLRAAMGAHFGLRLVEGLEPAALALAVPMIVTGSHAGSALHEQQLPWPCAWVFGHEGQGVQPALEAAAGHRVRIAQPGGQESLNVAAAAAICLHASGVVARSRAQR